MFTQRIKVTTVAISALAAFQSASAQDRVPGQTVPSTGQAQLSDQQISANQNQQGIGQNERTNDAQTRPGVTRPATGGAIVDGQGTLSGQGTAQVQTPGSNGQGVVTGAQGIQNGQRGQAGQTAQDSHQGLNVQQVVVHKLMRGNQAEIELAQIAQQEAKHDEVKQFAQMMIKDHQQALQELQRQQQNGAGSQNAASQSNADSANANGQATADEQALGNAQRGLNQAVNANQSNQGQARFAGYQQDQVPQQLVQVIDKTCENSLQQSKEMLQQHSNKDFDMAYIGHQIVMHSMMLAELQAIESEGPKQLQPLIQDARRKTESHLQEAKQIAERLASNEKSGDKQSEDSQASNTQN